ncbi:STAS domain-containing protein [Undibacterium sp. SXout20W]|uniref:STAS domain-containing protein n=1 Tax=Undibacterium sp. SXout20W TaxID=3413051 RepID=UPI003BF29365
MYKLAGELTQNNARVQVAAGNAAITQGQLDFDFSDLVQIDSTAVASMIEWQREAAKKHQTLHFHSVPVSVISLIQLYGLTGQFQLSPAERH